MIAGCLARLWAASGIFLNSDEALHFRLANQPSLALAYKASLTAAHPPLLILLLHYWRVLGTSDLWLRLPSVLAGAAFCWMFYKWLANAAGQMAGFIGLLFIAFLPPIVLLFAEVRQYPLLLAFLASALYFLDEAFAKNSLWRMAASSLFLYLAMLVHYSAFLFAVALGIYALIRIAASRPIARVSAAWAASQLGVLLLALFLYQTHLSKLNDAGSGTALQGWVNEYYLRRSVFDPAHDNPVIFLVGHTFGVFQYFFGQLAVGIVMGVFFSVGVALLFWQKTFAANQRLGTIVRRTEVPSQLLGTFLLLPFAIASLASLAHKYPYGGTRHLAFLIIPGIAGVSIAIARLAACRWGRAIGMTAVVLVACVAFGKLRQPRMDRANQSEKNMTAAIQFIRQNVSPLDLIFTDYQTDLILGHYLCNQRPIAIQPSPEDFEQFSCAGHEIVSTDYKTAWMFSAEDFPTEWLRLVKSYNLKPGDSVWIIEAGWGVDHSEDLRSRLLQVPGQQLESFGKSIKIFRRSLQ